MNRNLFTKSMKDLAMLIRLVAAFLMLTSPAVAESEALAEDKTLVLACLERLDADEKPTQWGQCLNLIFTPCADEVVGSEPHLSCLAAQRVEWRLVLENLQGQIFGAITPEGSSELATLLGQWTGYVVQKCEAVGVEKSAISKEAGQVGCEITEIVGLSGEYAACLEGRSAAPYCVFAE